MPELIITLEAKNKADYEDKKFLASLQGIDLEGENSSNGQNKWEEMKTKFLSGGATSNSNDIISLQGKAAAQAGFGIGMGLDYEVIS